MRKSTSEKKTLKFYDDNARSWGETHHGFEEESYWKKEMQKFNKLLPTGKIIEIGSGTGKDANNLIKLGYDFVGTDASIGLLKLARERNPNTDFRHVRVQDLTSIFSKEAFDGFWSAATLLHIPKNEIDKVLDGISSIVRVGGIGFVTMKEGEGEIVDETGRLFVYYSQAEFANLLTEHGFEIIYKDIREVSEKTTWLVFIVRKIG